MTGYSPSAMDSLLNNSRNFLNNKGELGESNHLSVPNSQSKVSEGNTDSTGVRNAQSYICNATENKNEKFSVNRISS